MKKLVLLSILASCLSLFAVYANTIGDDNDKVVVVVKNNGDKVAVDATDVDSIIFDERLNVDERFFLLDKDTVVVRDTLLFTDTIVERDTITKMVTVAVSSNLGRYYIIENPSVEAFINDFEYDPNDYTYSYIDRYLSPTSYDKERPSGVRIIFGGMANRLSISEDPDNSKAQILTLGNSAYDFIAYNLIPGRHYYWHAYYDDREISSNHFYTLGRVRMINLPHVNNVRDIGGMRTRDGHHTAYGRVFRGGTLSAVTDADISILLDTLGINAEIDVIQENNQTTSPTLGPTVSYASFTGQNINRIAYPSYYGAYYASVMRKVKEYLSEGKVIYLHCGGGADRTGAIALLLEGLAGCSESDIAKDYELTSFSVFGERKRIDGVQYQSTVYNYASVISYLKRLGKATFQDNVKAYLKKIGLTDDEIVELQNLLIE